MKKGGDIGGYHSVAMPFLPDAEAAVEQFKTGEVTWIELSVTPDQKSIDIKNAKQLSSEELAPHINDAEPRFYLYKFGMKTVFIYCCPSKSQTKSRMVYSTCKPSVSSRIAQLGVEADKKLEFSDVEDFTHASISEEFSPKKSYAYSSPAATSSKPKTVNIGGGSHPVYGLMNDVRAIPC